MQLEAQRSHCSVGRSLTLSSLQTLPTPALRLPTGTIPLLCLMSPDSELGNFRVGRPTGSLKSPHQGLGHSGLASFDFPSQ